MDIGSKKGSQKIKHFPAEDELQDLDKTGEKFRHKLMAEADKYEKELNEDKSLDFIDQMEDVTDPDNPPKLFRRIVEQLKAEGKWEETGKGCHCDKFREEFAQELCIEKIYDYLPENDRKAYDIGKKKLSHRKRDRALLRIGSVALIFLCLFGASMTSEANREYVLGLWHRITGTGYNINVETVSEAIDDTTAEHEAYQKMQDELDITPMRFSYKPEEMKFSSYVIEKHSKMATMQYLYKDIVINIFITKGEEDTLRSQKFNGKVIKSFQIQYNSLEYADVVELQNENGEKSYAAELEHNNAYYTISGVMAEKDFTKLLKNIYF